MGKPRAQTGAAWGWRLSPLSITFGLVCLAAATVNLTKDLSLWILGRRTTAEVVEAWVEQSDDSVGPPSFQYFVRYRFAPSGRRTFTRTSRAGVREWASLGMAEPVDAIYQ